MAVSGRRRSARHRRRARYLTCEALAPEPVSRAFRRARIDAHLDTDQLARRAGIGCEEVAAIDTGQPADVPGTVEFLRDLDRLAAVLGLPGGQVVEETLAQWARAFAEHGRDLQEAQQRAEESPTHDQAPPNPAEELAPRDGSPSTPPGGQPPLRGRAEALLRGAVLVAGLLLLGSSVVLGLAQAGLMGIHTRAVPHGAVGATPPATASPGTLLSLVGTGPSSASYWSHSGTLSLCFVASRPSWVEVSTGNAPPLLATIVGPGTTAPITVAVPFTAQIGAGGTHLLVSSGTHSQLLSPPSAPFTFSVVPG